MQKPLSFFLGGGGRGTPYNALYWEAPPERVSFSGFRYMQG